MICLRAFQNRDSGPDAALESKQENLGIYNDMLTFLCSLISAFGTFYALRACGFSQLHPAWTIIFAALAFVAIQVLAALILRKITASINLSLQDIMTETQKKIQMMQNRFMQRPLGQAQMMRELEKEQSGGIDRLLAELRRFRKLYPWNFLLKKQVCTMRMMFLYQQKKMDEVDALLPHCLFLDAQSMAMKMARLYVHNDDAALDRFFKRKCRRKKGDDALLLYSVYAWVLVKRERIDEARKVLEEAKAKTSDNPVIIRNWEMLANNKIKHFSNSQLGDVWYALRLETPKMPRVQQQIRRH